MKVTGAVWKFAQDDINTDQIRSRRYAYLPAKDQAKYCFEDLDPQFSSKVQPGDIIVAGRNFGCGSSTVAYSAVIALGVSAVVAESFSRLFFRHCIAAGLIATPCPGITELAETGARLELDTEMGEARNLTTGKVLTFPPLPAFLREMAELGGEKAYLMARLGITEESAEQGA